MPYTPDNHDTITNLTDDAYALVGATDHVGIARLQYRLKLLNTHVCDLMQTLSRLACATDSSSVTNTYGYALAYDDTLNMIKSLNDHITAFDGIIWAVNHMSEY